MKEELNKEAETFITKLNNKEYISTHLYKLIEVNYKNLIPKNFNLDSYNDEIIEREYQAHKEYFDNMYKGIDDNIHLDKEQIKAILSDEDYSLIIAGAGTGKTTTMASKVKYLVDIKKVDPSKIVVMSYTKKATEELEKRIVLDFDIPVKVTTFHSLGLMHIREIFKDRKCYVVDENKKEEIFLEYFKDHIFPYKDKVKELIEVFNTTTTAKQWVFGSFFQENYDKYATFDEYFESYKKYRLSEILNLKEWIYNMIDRDLNSETITTIKGEIVKSKGEAIIANFLYKNGIEYEYEKIYKDFMPERKIYLPDFTLSLGGSPVYLEYFGLSTYDDKNLNRYNKIRKIKEDYHQKHHSTFIKIDYKKGESIINTLKEELTKLGFTPKPRTDIEIFSSIIDKNKLSQFYPFKDFMLKIIDTIKSTSKRENYHQIVDNYILKLPKEEKEMAIKQFKYIDEFYKFYQTKLYGSENYGFDFSDMIYYANLYINKIDTNNNLNFEYLIIDEYQDISEDRYRLTKNIANRNIAKVVAVGDDWQSIFAFAGSKIEYIYNFMAYFPGAKILKITSTYRNSQKLIDYSGTFVMKNEDQIKKELISSKNITNPIKFITFKDEEEIEVLKGLIRNIHKTNPDHNIMVLARTNKIIENCYNDPELKDDIGTKIKYIGYEDIDIDGMTIHKSKGLTADEVIVIGLDSSFPRNYTGLFWMESLFKNKLQEEKIPFAEERRLFYVALTRTKNYVYLLTNNDPNNRSPFINEIYSIVKERNI